MINQFFGANTASVAGMLNGSTTTATNTVLGNQFLTSGPTCSFVLNTNTAVSNQNIGIGTTDTIGSYRFVSGTCGGTMTSFNFTKSGTSADSNYTNIKLYKGNTLIGGILPNLAMLNNFTSLTIGLVPNDTIIFTVVATVNPNATIGETISTNAYAIITDSVYGLNSIISNSSASGQTMTTSGCILQASKNTSYPNMTVTPTTNVKIGSFNVIPVGGCAVNVQFASLSNVGNVTNSYITNIMIKKGINQLGATVPTMGASAIFTFNDVITSTATYDVYADISTNAVNGDSIKIIFNATGVNTGTSTLVWTQNATGQLITINNPTAYNLTTQLNTAVSNQTVATGTQILVASFEMKSTGAHTKVQSMGLNNIGTGGNTSLSNLVIKTNGVTLGSSSIVSTNMFVPINDTLFNGVSKIYNVYVDISSTAVNLSTIQFTGNLGGVNLTTSMASINLPVNGQVMTISNPTTPCVLNTAIYNTGSLLPQGATNHKLAAFVSSTTGCNIDITSLKVEVQGTASVPDVNTFGIKVGSTLVPFGSTMPLMGYINTFTGVNTISSGTIDTFYLYGNIDPNAFIGGTYEFYVTLNGIEQGTSNPKTTSFWLDTKTISTGAPSSVNQTSKEKISVYPNPATDFITVEGLKEKEIQIFDMYGKKISVSFLNNKGYIKDLPNGMYFIQATNYSAKFIKE